MTGSTRNRVVVSGIGVCAPGTPGREPFWDLLESGRSAVSFQPEMKEAGFACQIGGSPQLDSSEAERLLGRALLRNGYSQSLLYAAYSADECWNDAGLTPPDPNAILEDVGCIFGCGTHGIDELRRAIYQVDAGRGRKLRSTTVFQTMNSGSAAYLSGKYGLGGYVSANSTACATGCESLMLAYQHIASGQARAMLAGSTSEGGVYVWGGFDAMRILPRTWNECPEEGSRPLDAESRGFVPASGAACFYLETLQSAFERGAHIYGEILGGFNNCGGHRQGGSMTAVNPFAARACVRQAISASGIQARDIDVVNGHLTGTDFDEIEIRNWIEGLGVEDGPYPWINTFKGHIGHALAASGSLEIAGVLGQFERKAIFPNANLNTLKEGILSLVSENRDPFPRNKKAGAPKLAIKASFGFGDVNSCIVLKNMNSI